jgi:polyphosphate glucokinase
VRVLVVDIGGSRVKFAVAGTEHKSEFESSPEMGPSQMLDQIAREADAWTYNVVSIGYPGRVGPQGPTSEPGNLVPGWVGFDFAHAFGKPVRVVNDAVLQALGAYEGKRMLFLGLGTGLGSALITERVAVPLELGELPYGNGATLVDILGRQGLETLGHALWQEALLEVTPALRLAFLADYVVFGGGNAARIEVFPPNAHRGGNDDAIEGGLRLWQEVVEPHDREPSPFWRVVE